MAVLKQRFRDLIQGVAAPEIAKIEQKLMNEGMPAEEIKRLSDVHVEIFKEALARIRLWAIPGDVVDS